MKKAFMGAVLFVSFATQLFAHQLWLEREGMVVREYFGHFPDFKEKEDGKRLGAIKGLHVSPKEAYIQTKRQKDHIEITLNSEGDIGVTEEMSPRKGKFVDFVVRTIFLAREGRAENKQLLEVDIVPESKNSNTFVLMYKNTPLPKTKINVVAPNTWSKSFSSDEAGKVTIETPWNGEYVLQLNYEDKVKGEADGKAYEQTNYVMTLHFEVE